MPEELRKKVFHEHDIARIERMCEIRNVPAPEKADKEFLKRYIKGTHIVITSWRTACLDEDVMQIADSLKLLAHAGGSVKPVVSQALWARNVNVTSAAAAISYGVAEFCLGMILLAPKRAFQAAIAVQNGQWQEGLKVFNGPQEIYQENVGIIGASHVGRHLIRLLSNFTCNVLLFDPYYTKQQADAIGVEKVGTLEELFERSLVVSLNAPSTAETANMIRGRHLELLPDGGVFINTSRGAIVNQEEMIEELKKGRIIACLDVTEPEPPPLDSPLRSLPNVWLTPHEAGVTAQNMRRVGTFVADEIEAFSLGKDFHFQITEEMLSRIG